jgi:uncharacterized protein YbjT (DUF2867 family)
MNLLIFGATGTAGGGVLKAVLSSPVVKAVRVITRRPLSRADDKIRTYLHRDFLDYAAVSEAFQGVDACFYCLGVSVGQVSGEREYRTITHDYALAAAQMLKTYSPNTVFHFISGQGTRLDSHFMWSRVKAESERDLMLFTHTICWRPGYIDGELSTSSPRLYRLIHPLARLLKPFRSLYVEGEDIGRAMLLATTEKMGTRIIENAEIRAMADRYR